MEAAEYIKDRLDDQINWHDKKSGWNQRRYKRLRIAVLIISVLIPFAAGFITTFDWLSYVVGFLGVLVASFEGLLSLNKYHENWTQYRLIAEQLQKEKYYYSTQSSVYADTKTPFQTLVQRTEAILAKENEHWADRISDAKNS